ncbi:hypothetical protein [Streptomyces hydrogenans]|uniref:Uncharacterized protein n=1 Tax=Streptomyces hydrogenans TaxID=1873719 RepID=A0ABQ3PQM6_9ACTN|nr:hypothetical protein [Streptomyces hydrogenans]GHG43186.1 hypothetical protein GCM10018784_66330 [Streptomyces hydrogenans]GHI27326.1 hypothetical protein Shyd_86970 [Streptomyces hydrogenans]
MTFFQCGSCRRAVTPTIAERSLPTFDTDDGWHRPEASPSDANGHSTDPVVRMPPGTFAVDPDPSGPPYVLDEVSGFLVESGPRGTIVLNPADGLGLEEHPDVAMRRGYCCGMDGEWGPNLVCMCGAAIATLYSDCYQVQELRLQPDTVERCP